MIAAQVSDAYLAPIIATSFMVTLALIGWIVKMLLSVSVQQGRHAEILDDHDRRLDTLERTGEERRRWQA